MPYAKNGRKVCSACRVEQDLSAFARNAAQKDGLHNQCRPCSRKAHRRHYHQDLARSRRIQMESHRRRKYGVSPDEFLAMVAATPECPGCGRRPPEVPFVVDHVHETGKVRGILCRSCNLILGHVDDDPVRLRRLVAYLSE